VRTCENHETSHNGIGNFYREFELFLFVNLISFYIYKVAKKAPTKKKSSSDDSSDDEEENPKTKTRKSVIVIIFLSNLNAKNLSGILSILKE